MMQESGSDTVSVAKVSLQVRMVGKWKVWTQLWGSVDTWTG